MKLIVVAALLCVAVTAAIVPVTIEQQFATFKKHFKKEYKTNAEEKRRLAIFSMNMKRAAAMGRANPLATFGPTKFADLTPAEFKQYLGGANSNTKNKTFTTKIAYHYNTTSIPPASCDWRKKGVVTPVKDQGECASWAYGITGSVEAQWALANTNHKLTSLSEQELYSCFSGCTTWKALGDAYDWILNKRKGQIVTTKAFPDVTDNDDPPCPYNLENLTVGAVITSYRDLPHDEDQMAMWVCDNGPITVAVDATSWQMYTGGILSNCMSGEVQHYALVVGVNVLGRPPYWIIKNSWSKGWGEDGYIRLLKGNNQCMIIEHPSTSVPSKNPLP